MTPRDQLDLTGLCVLDGGLATELERAGCNLASPLWSGEVLRTQPEKVLAVHRSYLEAGADCLLTASYQVSAMGFREIGLTAADARSAIQQSVALVEQARREYTNADINAGRQPRRIWIAGSLGAYSAALHNGAEFHGTYDIGLGELVAFHTERIDAMRNTAADFLAFETVPSLAEAEAILEALASFPDLAAYISFTCRDDARTGHGEPIEQCARLLDPAPQILAIGINCTAPRHTLPLIQKIRAFSTKRIAVYPNSGETWVQKTRSWAGYSDPGAFGDMAREWRKAGADWIGGCCRTGPDHIKMVAKSMTATLDDVPPGVWQALLIMRQYRHRHDNQDAFRGARTGKHLSRPPQAAQPHGGGVRAHRSGAGAYAIPHRTGHLQRDVERALLL